MFHGEGKIRLTRARGHFHNAADRVRGHFLPPPPDPRKLNFVKYRFFSKLMDEIVHFLFLLPALRCGQANDAHSAHSDQKAYSYSQICLSHLFFSRLSIWSKLLADPCYMIFHKTKAPKPLNQWPAGPPGRSSGPFLAVRQGHYPTYQTPLLKQLGSLKFHSLWPLCFWISNVSHLKHGSCFRTNTKWWAAT